MNKKQFETLLVGAYFLGLLFGIAPTLSELAKTAEKLTEMSKSCPPNQPSPRQGPAQAAEAKSNKNTSNSVSDAEPKQEKQRKTKDGLGKT